MKNANIVKISLAFILKWILNRMGKKLIITMTFFKKHELKNTERWTVEFLSSIDWAYAVKISKSN